MATTYAYKILGQQAPSATTETTLYTVPSSTQTVISTIVVCNRGGSATTFRIYFAPAGAGTSNSMYTHFDVNINANDSFAATLGVTLATTDVIRVFAGNANLTFSAFGTEFN